MKLEIFIPLLLLCANAFALTERKEKKEITKEVGIPLIAPLLEGEESNTTNLRVEKKNILHFQKINQYLDPFLKLDKNQKRKVQFTIRDNSLKKKRSLTTTFYGKKIFFMNGLVKTNIKLRARVYSTKEEKKQFKRIKKLKNKFFLELKLKNATPKELNVSRKYRMLISDEALEKLYRIDATGPNFSEEWNTLEQPLAEANPKRTKEDIQKFLRIAKNFALLDPEFIKPLYVVQYSRVAFKYEEEFKPNGIFTKASDIHNHEYQITMDRDINVFEIDHQKFYRKKIWDYVKEDMPKDLFYKYEKEVRVIEFKYPLDTTKRDYQCKSSVSKELQAYFAYPLFDYKQPYADYKKNKGKLASAFKILEIRSAKKHD